MKKVQPRSNRSNTKLKVRIDARSAAEEVFHWPDGSEIDSGQLLLSLLLPTAVKEVFRRLEDEAEMLCGKRYERGNEYARWGTEEGSIYLGGQKVGIKRPRVRGPQGEVVLKTYEKHRNPAIFEERVYREGVRKISQRDYKKGVETVGAAFGFSKGSVSKHWKHATEKKLRELNDRRLEGFKIVAVFIDGKRFRKEGAMLALGVGEGGKKQVLGVYQSTTENKTACKALLDNLEKRGLPTEGVLFIVDGGTGLNKALEEKYAVDNKKERRAVRLRCHNHKFRNLEDILGKDTKAASDMSVHFWNMRNARGRKEAEEHASKLEKVLRKANLSAHTSFIEAKEDLLVLHELGLSQQLKKFFSTTNPIESLNGLLEEDTRRVKRWHDSSHFQRWVATAILENEKRMRRPRGFQRIVGLRAAVHRLCKIGRTVKWVVDEVKKAA